MRFHRSRDCQSSLRGALSRSFNRIDWSQQVDRVKVATDKLSTARFGLIRLELASRFLKTSVAPASMPSPMVHHENEGRSDRPARAPFEQRRIVLPKAQLAPFSSMNWKHMSFRLASQESAHVAPPAPTTIRLLALVGDLDSRQFSTKEQPTHEIASALFKCLGRESLARNPKAAVLRVW